MKKITFISIVIFLSTLSFLFIANLFMTPASSSSNSVKDAQNIVVTQFKSPNIDLTTLANKQTSHQGKHRMLRAQVAKHNSKNDCYLIINGNIYDVTPYMPYHPAGSKIIAKYCGNEVTNIFSQIHSNRAWDLLSKYKVGVIYRQQKSDVPKILNALQKAFQEANPEATVLKIIPKKEGYLVKTLLNNVMYEVHLDATGTILKEETNDVEINWNIWDKDTDDM